MFGLFSRQKKLSGTLDQYRIEVLNAKEMFYKAMMKYLDEGSSETFNELITRTHKYESKADDLRRDIEQSMYTNSLLPDSRGDILGLIESYDKIPGIYERILNFLRVRDLKIPEEIKTDMVILLSSALQSNEIIVEGIDHLITQPKKVSDDIKLVDQLESKCDLLERNLILSIFHLKNIDPLQKELLTKVVEDISSLADEAEETGTRLQIAAIKRIM